MSLCPNPKKRRSIFKMGNVFSRNQEAKGGTPSPIPNNQKEILYGLHKYIESPDDIDRQLERFYIIRPESGYRVEMGGVSGTSPSNPVLEDVEKYSLYYKENFCNKKHENYLGGNSLSPLSVSIVQLDKFKGGWNFCAYVRSKRDNYIYNFVSKSYANALKHVRRICPDIQDELPLLKIKDPLLVDELVHMEERFLVKACRIGVIYAGYRTEENDMLSNIVPSEGFTHFMGWLAERITLKDWTRFRGGLDVQSDTTGTHSYFSRFQLLDIMFHVSTELPYSPLGKEQIERKRHIGNDVVVVIYQDGPSTEPFAATRIVSKFNHVYVVIQAIQPDAKEPLAAVSSDQPSESSTCGSVVDTNQHDDSKPVSEANGHQDNTSGHAGSPVGSAHHTPKSDEISKDNSSTKSIENASKTDNSPEYINSYKSKNNNSLECIDGHASNADGVCSLNDSIGSNDAGENLNVNGGVGGTRHPCPVSELRYRVAVVSKHGVKYHGPVLPEIGYLWKLDDSFKNFLLTKLINAERAAYYAPGFSQLRTRRMWLKQLTDKFGGLLVQTNENLKS